MTTSYDFASPVHLKAVSAPGQPTVTPALEELYRGFEQELLIPLWTEIGDLMPAHPRSKAVPHRWRWDALRALAARAGELVPVGRGGERRAIALANPGLGGRPFATPTLWAAIQYLMPGENAPEHRHTQHAFRFVLEGEGVWTVVGGDPVAMRRGDFLPQAGWNWHAHHNATTEPMAWIDGLDIPLQYITEAQFFELGRDEISDEEKTTPERSRAERLWGHPGLTPIAKAARPTGPGSPLLAYRWERTDRALDDQLALEREGYPGTVEPGHAAVRYTDPATGGDVLPTIRVEMHRIARDAQTRPARETGSSVYAVFDGSGTVTVGDATWSVGRGDLFVVPSWQPFSAKSEAGLHRLRLGRARPVPLQRLPGLRGAQAQPRQHGGRRPVTLPTTQPDVIVVGGGIGGLSAAFALTRQGVSVRVLERSAEFAEVGAGLQLAPNCTRILDDYGLLDEAKQLGVLPRSMVMKDALDGSVLTSLDLNHLGRRYGSPYLVMHRSDLHGLFLRACQRAGVDLRTSQHVTEYENTESGAKVTLADGTEHAASLVIAADGLHSTARQRLVGDEPVNSAYVAYRGAVPIEKVRENNISETDVVVYIGPRCHFVQYPLRGGEMFNQVAVFESAKARRGEHDWGTPDELDAAFARTTGNIQLGLPLMWRDRWWRMFDRDPIDTWVHGRIALLGDAAHPPLQYIAQGAIMAIEDGYVLAEHLAATGTPTPPSPPTRPSAPSTAAGSSPPPAPGANSGT